jgi:4-hydroxy-3-methylbut-2-enyl diphosphate reductase
MKQFTIPFSYRSPLLSAIKTKRKAEDKLKKDFTPTLLDFGNTEILLARHFGFCYGVENAIEIAFKTVHENPGKRIYLLSEMIHNPSVNRDLMELGIRFIQDTSGKQLVPFEQLSKEDIVLIPAFGTTLDIEKKLADKGIITEKFNTTCPFVEKVWNRSQSIAKSDFTIIIHGKPAHEETRATFSHAARAGKALVIKNMKEAELLAEHIEGKKPRDHFFIDFEGRFSQGFDPSIDLKKIGVVNQTTMLAADTQAIADFLKSVISKRDMEKSAQENFADTKDTLCYATNDNQSAVYGMLEEKADLAIIVGGYNSSNTSHLVHLCEEKLPSYFIEDASKIHEDNSIQHFILEDSMEKITSRFLPEKEKLRIMITCGASCPDSIVEKVMEKLLMLRKAPVKISDQLQHFS